MASFPLFKVFRVGTTFNYLSAIPYNITTGFDNNGDAVINDRPVGLTRNSARGAGQFNLGTRLSWGFGWGKSRRPPNPHHYVQTSPFFGQAIAAMPGRRLETGMRFSF